MAAAMPSFQTSGAAGPAHAGTAHPCIARRTLLAGALALLAGSGCRSQAEQAKGQVRSSGPPRPQPDLYDCEGCEGASERPPGSLQPHARIAAPGEPGERMRIEGVVYRPDGATPAANVVIYAYHTDAGGRYSRGTPETEESRRHGLLRGWVRTGADGRYSFDTVKPGPYPGGTEPAHVHLTVLEPGRRPYWIDEIVFAGEFGVTDEYRRKRENRGGDGIVQLVRRNGLLVARRDIILEPHP
jgi:protocatechuate 3,4-dioxygenase beta subunit